MPTSPVVGNFSIPQQKPENHKAGRLLPKTVGRAKSGDKKGGECPIRLVKPVGHSSWRGGGNIRRGE